MNCTQPDCTGQVLDGYCEAIVGYHIREIDH